MANATAQAALIESLIPILESRSETTINAIGVLLAKEPGALRQTLGERGEWQLSSKTLAELTAMAFSAYRSERMANAGHHPKLPDARRGRCTSTALAHRISGMRAIEQIRPLQVNRGTLR